MFFVIMNVLKAPLYCLLLLTIQNGTTWKGVTAKITCAPGRYEKHQMFGSKDKSKSDPKCSIMFQYPAPTCE